MKEKDDVPPGPRKVPRPEAAESPAPHSAMILFEPLRTSPNFSTEVLGPFLEPDMIVRCDMTKKLKEVVVNLYLKPEGVLRRCGR